MHFFSQKQPHTVYNMEVSAFVAILICLNLEFLTSSKFWRYNYFLCIKQSVVSHHRPRSYYYNYWIIHSIGLVLNIAICHIQRHICLENVTVCSVCHRQEMHNTHNPTTTTKMQMGFGWMILMTKIVYFLTSAN